MIHSLTTTSRFNGADYNHQRDSARLENQYHRIFSAMQDGQPRTLKQIAELTNDPESSISAQLRHMRKPRFGGHTINRVYISNGLFTYQLIVNVKAAA